MANKLQANSIPHWSRIGRLRRTTMPKLQSGTGGRANFAEKAVASGRVLVDIKVSAREFVRQTTYELQELVQVQLGAQRTEVDTETVRRGCS